MQDNFDPARNNCLIYIYIEKMYDWSDKIMILKNI